MLYTFFFIDSDFNLFMRVGVFKFPYLYFESIIQSTVIKIILNPINIQIFLTSAADASLNLL